MLIKTINRGVIDIPGARSYSLVDSRAHWPHWCWWVVIMLTYWPLLFILLMIGLVRRRYTIQVEGGDGYVDELDVTEKWLWIVDSKLPYRGD
jgi:hypothetical protein